MKNLLMALMFAAIGFHAVAQKNGVATGTLVDSLDRKKMIGYATISLFKGKDTVLTSYRLSDEKGIFKLMALEGGNTYRMIVNAWGYKVYRRVFKMPEGSQEFDLGTILLTESSNTIGEVEIVGERPPVMVRRDTIEFNAESFKTLPTAMVEDLLRKLPGVTVGTNGTLMVNGRAVSRILVDGKEFFGGDQQIATKNLPANIIDKIQVNDDQDAKRADPDLIAANTPQVINLKLKKAIKQGAFGKIYGGAGPKEYFEAGGIMSFFRDTTQISVLAYGNNINRSGFSIGEVQRLGGFGRSGLNSVMISSDGGFALDNISFGGLGTGVQRSAGAGANFNTLTKGGTKINAKYFFGKSNTVTEQLVNDNQTLGSNELITRSNTQSRSVIDNHNLSARIDWKLDSLTTFTLNPLLSFNPTAYLNVQNKVSNRGDGTPLNAALTDINRSGDNKDLTLNAHLWKDFKKKGRVLNTSMNITWRDNLENTYNNSNSTFFTTNSQLMVDQLRDNDIRHRGAYLSANFTEPIGKKFSLTTTFTGNYLNNQNKLFTFLKTPGNMAYDVLVPSQTEQVTQEGVKANVGGRLRWTINKDLSIQPGITYSMINLNNTFASSADIKQQFNFIFPALNIRYKIASIGYSANLSEPQTQYIQPVLNNTDPLFIQNGNPNLRPTENHNVNLNIYKYDTKRALNYQIYGNLTLRNNAIITSRVIGADGVQTTTPVNVNGSWNASGNGTVTKEFKSAKRQISVTGGFNYAYSRNMLRVNNIASEMDRIGFTPRGAVRLNLNDKFELNQTYSITFNKSTYTDAFFRDQDFNSQSTETELVIRYPKKLVFETNYRMQINQQDVIGYNNNIRLWNAGVTYLFMKNDRAQLKLSVNDILEAGVRRFVTINENYIRDTQSNNIGRYFLMTMTYNIQNFGGKVGGKERFFGL